MKDTELVATLRNLKVLMKRTICLNCFDGEGCDINGCRLIGLAADRIAEYDSALENIKAVYNLASGSEKSLLQDVIALFDPAYGNSSNLRNHIAQKQKRNPRSDAIDAIRYAWTLIPPKKRITDFERCADTAELADTLRCIDDNGYEMSGVTQDSSGVYTVFFRRSVSE